MINIARLLVTVTEILDNDRFRGTWQGQCYEARALPDTSNLSVGDAAFCHVLPGSTELVAVYPPSEVMYIAPGHRTTDAVGELYRWTGNGVPVLEWELPAGTAVTAMGQMSTNKLVYLAVFDEYDKVNYLYSMSAKGGAKTLIKTYICPQSAEGGEPWKTDIGDPCTQMAEFGGWLYLSHTAYWGDYSWVARYNPATDTLENSVVWNTDTNGGAGGLGVSGGKLWWSSGNFLYSTSDGVNWTLKLDFKAANNWSITAGLVTDPINDAIYFGYCIWDEPTSDRVGIAKISAGALPVSIFDYQIRFNNDMPSQFTITHIGNLPQAVYTGTWGDGIIYKTPIDGATMQAIAGLTDPLLDTIVLPENQAMLTFKKKVYHLASYWDIDTGNRVMLYEIDPTIDVRRLVHTFSLCRPYNIWMYGGCLCVTDSPQKVHEM